MVQLIAFSGLPGTGKTTIAKALTRHFPSVYLRLDEVEAALKRSTLAIHPAEDAGYLAIAAIASSNLQLGKTVITDTVNPVRESRQIWSDTAQASGVQLINIEVVCSDKNEHRRRVEARSSKIDGLALPDWEKVIRREYEQWNEPVLRIDSSLLSVEAALDKILTRLTAIKQTA